ncbi:MAG TPA: YciI family protein [Polyangiaceae bacterium]|nr:YciI family protein [Polyangiaceae bacterium]
MSTTKFLYLYRSPANAPSKPPSPEQLQAMFAAWTAWKTKFDDEIIDMGDALKATGGAVYKAGIVTDGPFIEAKEIMGGYSIVQTASLARAVEIAKACPMNEIPGASIEVRELAGYE